MDTARSSGLGHGLLHAVSAHLSHLMPPPPPPEPAVPVEAEHPNPVGRLRPQHGRGMGVRCAHSAHSSASAASGSQAPGGSKPTTPSSVNGAARGAGAVAAEEGAPRAACAPAVDALAVVPEPLAAAVKVKGGKKAQKYEARLSVLTLPVLREYRSLRLTACWHVWGHANTWCCHVCAHIAEWPCSTHELS